MKKLQYITIYNGFYYYFAISHKNKKDYEKVVVSKFRPFNDGIITDISIFYLFHLFFICIIILFVSLFNL